MSKSNNPFQTAMQTMQVPAHMSKSIAISGFELEADKDGLIEVPKHLVDELKAHGLTDYVEPEAKKSK